MSRLTITLSDECHRALREAASRQHKTIRAIIEESLRFYGIKSTKTASDYVAQARQSSKMNGKEALKLAVRETRAARH